MHGPSSELQLSLLNVHDFSPPFPLATSNSTPAPLPADHISTAVSPFLISFESPRTGNSPSLLSFSSRLMGFLPSHVVSANRVFARRLAFKGSSSLGQESFSSQFNRGLMSPVLHYPDAAALDGSMSLFSAPPNNHSLFMAATLREMNSWNGRCDFFNGPLYSFGLSGFPYFPERTFLHSLISQKRISDPRNPLPKESL